MACALSIGTLNTHGSADDRVAYIKEVMIHCDFLLVQEHWLHNKQLACLQSKLGNVRIHGVSGMDSNMLLSGRPYGGCAIIWNKNLQCSVTPLNIPSNRVCGVKVNFEKVSFLIFCVYMPTEGINNDFVDSLNHMSVSIQKSDVDRIIIGGDFNTDFSRVQSQHTLLLCDFLESESLKAGLELAHAACDYTFESKASGHRSLLDHIMFSQNIIDDVRKYAVCHDGVNLSDHDLVIAELKITASIARSDKEVVVKHNKLMWEKATDIHCNKYREILDRHLGDICIPWDAVQCNDLLCDNVKHFNDLEKLHNDLVNACMESSHETITCSNNKHENNKSRSIPGWSEFMEPEREKCMIWHNIWKDNGSPRNGILAHIRRSTRAKYHQAVKFVKQNNNQLKAESMAEAILHNQARNFGER